ncbi:MAG: SMP-30/gluconolactonase/LRE family protein [Bryobacter sp.]|nr:SMP-30/gluconolactonase/LRE family protein [Bryobacter sp.]
MLPGTLEALTINTSSYPTTGYLESFDDSFASLVAPEAQLEVIAAGFEWTEGPVWLRQEGALLFSDIPRNSIFRWKEGVGVELYLKPSGYTGRTDYGKEPGSNGLTLDASGQLVCCEHGDRRMSVLTHGGGKLTLADRYQGKRFNSPNDCCFRSNGDLYFTDPAYGLPLQFADPLREMDYCGVFRRAVDGTVHLLTQELSRPNGLAFSPDESILYVGNSDPARALWMAYPVLPDGGIGAGTVFADVTPMVGSAPGLPDGFKLDELGNVFATGPGGVLVYSPAGKLLGRINTGQQSANCAWGDDGSTLYICADMYLMRIRTRTRGRTLA